MEQTPLLVEEANKKGSQQLVERLPLFCHEHLNFAEMEREWLGVNDVVLKCFFFKICEGVDIPNLLLCCSKRFAS